MLLSLRGSSRGGRVLVYSSKALPSSHLLSSTQLLLSAPSVGFIRTKKTTKKPPPNLKEFGEALRTSFNFLKEARRPPRPEGEIKNEPERKYPGGFESSETPIMSRQEAALILGLDEDKAQDLKARVNAMLRINHPDSGGSDFLAAKILQAKQTMENSAFEDPAKVEVQKEQQSPRKPNKKEEVKMPKITFSDEPYQPKGNIVFQLWHRLNLAFGKLVDRFIFDPITAAFTQLKDLIPRISLKRLLKGENDIEEDDFIEVEEEEEEEEDALGKEKRTKEVRTRESDLCFSSMKLPPYSEDIPETSPIRVATEPAEFILQPPTPEVDGEIVEGEGFLGTKVKKPIWENEDWWLKKPEKQQKDTNQLK